MLEIKFLRQNLSEVKKAFISRGENIDVQNFIQNDERQRTLLAEIEGLRNRRNVVSDEIAKLKRLDRNAEERVLEMRQVGGRIKTLEKELGETEEKLKEILMIMPNLPHVSVPIGKDSQDNLVVKKEGTVPAFNFEPLPHWEIGDKLKILDFDRASKLAGARFPLYYSAGARLERALINFMLDLHTTEHGYMEVLPPFIVNRQSLIGTGQLPKFQQDLFKLEGWDYFLVPTAEVPVTNIHANEILAEEQLPIYYTAHTPCFRSEAGSYGKDTRGLIRQHQFNKVELVKFSDPEHSYEELEKLLKDAEEVLQKLGLPYQVINLCTGDLGFSAAKTYDIEVWLPSQGVYREISSCSNFESFQARRSNIRFKRAGMKGTEYVHTLNGSGLAVGRTLAAILENFQTGESEVAIPEVLWPYMGGMEAITV